MTHWQENSQDFTVIKKVWCKNPHLTPEEDFTLDNAPDAILGSCFGVYLSESPSEAVSLLWMLCVKYS